MKTLVVATILMLTCACQANKYTYVFSTTITYTTGQVEEKKFQYITDKKHGLLVELNEYGCLSQYEKGYAVETFTCGVRDFKIDAVLSREYNSETDSIERWKLYIRSNNFDTAGK